MLGVKVLHPHLMSLRVQLFFHPVSRPLETEQERD
jgi:hypothetical protein